jgi:large repetitive protein
MLPPGFAINPTTGVISGQSLVPGVYTFTVRVSDAGSKVALRRATITIYDNPTVTLTLPDGVVGVAYAGQVNASGLVSTPLVYSLTTGPSWMNVNSSTGAITGTPDATGANIPVIILVTGASSLGSKSTSDTINVT